MKCKVKGIMKTIFFSALFGMLVFILGFLYLDMKLERTETLENVNSVPYSAIPQNNCILMKICEDEIIVYLDFEQKIINVIFAEEYSERYGYTVDYTVECNYETVGYLVDMVGGIQLENIRFTGVQIIEMLEYTNTSIEVKQSIAEKIIDGIAKAGFTKESLLYIINNSETDLKFNTGFLWVSYIPELCKSPKFMN